MDEQTFENIFQSLSKRDIEWVVTEYQLNFDIPVNDAPQPLIKHGLVSRQMIKSGRNPEYGYTLTDKGRSFGRCVQMMALNNFLNANKKG